MSSRGTGAEGCEPLESLAHCLLDPAPRTGLAVSSKRIKKHRSDRQLKPTKSVYELLGVKDVNAFYADKFVWDPPPNIVEHDPTSRFNIGFVKQYWIYDRVSSQSRVLDVGCGSGTLNVLKSKGAYLVGVDLSENALEKALAAGYDEVIQCDSYDIPFPAESFDHVVSLDVIGHIENETKDAYLNEWARLLRPGGTMLHGIETDNVDYDRLDPNERDHILIDGHVGLEPHEKIRERFEQFFQDVLIENCMGLCYEWSDIEKYEKIERDIGSDWRDYILSFSHAEARAFNAAMRLMRDRLAKAGKLGPPAGFLFLEASGKKATAVQ